MRERESAWTTSTRRQFLRQSAAGLTGLAAFLATSQSVAAAEASPPSAAPGVLALAAGDGMMTSSRTAQGDAPRYEGRLVDAHLHTPRALEGPGVRGTRLFEVLDLDGYAWAVGFYFAPGDERARRNSARLATEAQARIIPLAAPSARTQGGFLSDYPSDGGLEAQLRALLRPEGAFAGIGEMPLYFTIFSSVTFQSPEMVAVFAAVEAARGIVMVHPRGPRLRNPTMRAEVQEALTRFPNAIFLLHGEPDFFDTIEPLMADHQNLYFSFDFPTWSTGSGGVSWGGAVEQAGSVEQFTFSVERAGGIEAVARRGAMLVGERAANRPDRSMIGTDRFIAWHFDPVVGQAVVEVSRQMIGMMPSEVQEPLAFGNAERILGPFLVT